jgi:hypothetical protein
MRLLKKLDAMSPKAIAVLCVFVFWLLIMAFALYGFGLSGLRAGLDPSNYDGHPLDYAMHWLLVVGPPLAAALLAGSAWLKGR